jgi:tetratricopeptide (TPR) repeat protein
MLRKLSVTSTGSDRGAERGAQADERTKDATLTIQPVDEERRRLIAQASKLDADGRHGQSLALLGRALAATPDDPRLLFARASTLFAWDRVREALEGYSLVESLGWQDKTLFLQLGRAHFQAGNLGEAERWMRKAASAEPGALDAHHGLTVALIAQQRLHDAIENCAATLRLYPDDFDSLVYLGLCKLNQGDPVAAEAHLRRATVVGPKQAAAWTHLGVSLGLQLRHVEALKSFERAQRLEVDEGGDRDSFVNLAVEHCMGGRMQEAIAVCENNLAQRPTVDGHRIYADALLAAGRLTEGWRHYEFRWLREPLLSLRPSFRRPLWAGQDLRGKTILLRIEQGFGDAIQFLRYALRVKALGAIVLLRIVPGFADLARAFPGIDRVLGPDEAPDFDYYIHLLSLPRVFGTDLDSIPADIPYLQAEPVRVVWWAKRLGADGMLRVGLAWAGSPTHFRDRTRSMPLRTLAPLMQLDGVRFFSLQKGPAATEAEALAAEPKWVDVGPELNDFSDTAAVISHLDLVICVDTAVAHLAGALGKPVWLMVQQDSDWRWLRGREDSPWYPTMRLFRQSRRGDWEEVVARVKTALEKRLQEGASAPPGRASAKRDSGFGPMLASGRDSNVAPRIPGLSAVAETRVGILQYFPDEPIVGASIDWYGEFLQPQLNLLARIIWPGATVMEVGAGVGAHALFLAAAVGTAGHLFLYEPRPLMQRVLRQNLVANRVAHVTVMRHALGGPAQSGVEWETVDQLQLEHLHLLKINDDGHRLEILDGAAETLWRLRPLLFISARDEPTFAELQSRARTHSYRCWRMETPFFNPENFNGRQDDLFSGSRALALLAIPEEIEVDIVLDGCVEVI